MALLRWSNKYSVGVKAMDDQHINLVKRLNELHAVMLKGKAQGVAGSLFKKLKDYTLEHFTDEEAMLEAARYPGLAKQQEEHHELHRKLGEFVARYEQDDQTIYPQLLYFVRDWLENHMQTEDKKFTTWMNEHGVH
jgi:methyl-accepting chemotaxis protein/hemerythrin